ncbi:TPA: peptide-methionine (R)-S-oxide reductase, partial [Burkholderia cenocepacia]
MPTRRHLLFAGATGLAALAALSSAGRRALVGRAFAAPPA